MLIEKDIHIAVITEHWLKEVIANKFLVQDFLLTTHFSRKDGYGGVLIFSSKELCVEEISQTKDFSVEGLLEMNAIWEKRLKTVVIAVYRLPEGSFEVFMENMKAGLDEINQLNINHVHIHVAGDFNVDLMKSCTRTDDILELGIWTTSQIYGTLQNHRYFPDFDR
ncbi:hypothetical protein HHI36_012180 [Cryptolaemus montrouzieri]|uniref:Uncharacterized protein n=1 Tax=Cryptolaemus montrouzieri TaxID=559131 RepID=A0ABD2NE52_9CUCU